MGHRFAEIAFTDTVKALQESAGSRHGYARMEEVDAPMNHVLGANEAAFIGARDSFYMATVSETGWPYVQHRGGPVGFVRTLDEKTIGFADLRGNRQYISVGNVMKDDRVSLFFMDYTHRTRLKLLGRAKMVDLSDNPVLSKLEVPNYRARVERGVLINVEAFDWNCPQHITERFTLAEVDSVVDPLRAKIVELEALLAGTKKPDA